MGVRSQLSWLIHARATTRSLVQRIEATELQMTALQKEISLLSDRQLDEFDKVRAAVAGSTDDLMARVDALRMRVDKP
jgi:hypothetical protein